VAISIVDICNSALSKVGGARISSLDDDTKEGRLCKELYPRASDELLRSHPWNFAIARIALAQTVATPNFGYDFQYELPVDCLRVINIASEFADSEDLGGSFIGWKIEGRKLLTNEGDINIKYIKDVSDTPYLFDANFTETLAYRLAKDLAYPLAQSNSLADRMSVEYRESLAFARSYDAQEGSSDRIGANEWITSRY
jgi:hypothetical protein